MCRTATFVHDLGSSSGKDPTLGIIRYNRGKELYFRIHQGVLGQRSLPLSESDGSALKTDCLVSKADGLWLSKWEKQKPKSNVSAG